MCQHDQNDTMPGLRVRKPGLDAANLSLQIVMLGLEKVCDK